MKKTISKLCFCILILSSLTSCGDYLELNKMAIVSAIGIDKTKDKKQPYTATFQIVNPSEVVGGAGTAASGKALTTINVKAKGIDMVDAARNASKLTPRPFFFGHNSLIVVNEAAAKDGIYKVLDIYERNPRVLSDTVLLVARKTSANKLLEIVSPLEKVSGFSIVGKVKHTQNILGDEFTTQIYEVVENLAIYGREATITGVTIQKKDEKAATQENTLRADAALPVIKGIGLFRNGKLVGWLDEKGGLVASLAMKKSKAASLSVPYKDGSFSLTITEIKGKLDTKWNNGKPILTFHVKGRGPLYEITFPYSFETPKDIMDLEKKAEAELEKQLKDGIMQAQEKESDIFGFGEVLRNKDPKRWKDIKKQWPTYFGKAEVRVKVQISIARTGMRNDPLDPIHGKGVKD